MNLLRRMLWTLRGHASGSSRSAPPPTILDRRGMNEDWKVGDLAVCVAPRWCDPCGEDPKQGELLRVSGMAEGVSTTGAVMITALFFEGKPNFGWECVGFRKVRPQHRAADVIFTAAIKHRHPEPVE